MLLKAQGGSGAAWGEAIASGEAFVSRFNPSCPSGGLTVCPPCQA